MGSRRENGSLYIYIYICVYIHRDISGSHVEASRERGNPLCTPNVGKLIFPN